VEGGDTPAGRISRGFRLVLGRRPTADELAVLVDGFEADREQYGRTPEAAEKFVQAGQSAAADRITPAEFAAYALAANVIINLDEFVTRD
jgi:hypothetical protein